MTISKSSGVPSLRGIVATHYGTTAESANHAPRLVTGEEKTWMFGRAGIFSPSEWKRRTTWRGLALRGRFSPRGGLDRHQTLQPSGTSSRRSQRHNQEITRAGRCLEAGQWPGRQDASLASVADRFCLVTKSLRPRLPNRLRRHPRCRQCPNAPLCAASGWSGAWAAARKMSW